MNNKQDWKNRYSLDEFDHNVLSEKDIFVGRFESTFGFEAKENIACLWWCPFNAQSSEKSRVVQYKFPEFDFFDDYFHSKNEFPQKKKEILIEGWNYVSCNAITSEIILLPKSRQSIANCNWDILLEANLLL